MNVFELSPDDRAQIRQAIASGVREVVREVLPEIVRAELDVARQLGAGNVAAPPLAAEVPAPPVD